MYEVRSVLEGRAARLAATRVSADMLAPVERELKSQRTKGDIDRSGLLEAGQMLHRLIIQSCGNHVLTQMIESVQEHFARFRALALNIPEMLLVSHQEHLEILEALKQANEDLAEERVMRHFEHAGRSLLESLLRSDGARFRITVASSGRVA
jgi:DNA-binding GntR family transcriptional regulator